MVLPGTPLAAKAAVSLRDCAPFPLILPKSNFANRDQLHPIFFESGMIDRGRYEAGSIELMKQLVLGGLGVAFMTRVGIEAELDAGRLVHVPLRQAGRPVFSELGLYARAATALPIAAEALAQELIELLNDSAARDLA
ncbi:MAG: LysR substrate-binding domain-containing protein [Pseudomonadota bacterium]